MPAEHWADWRKAYYLPHAHTPLPFHTPKPDPAKLGRQFLLKPSLILPHACGLLLHTPTHIHIHTHAFWVLRGDLFAFLFPCLCAHSQRAQEPSCHVSLLLTLRTKQFIRAWVESSLHIVLSVCFQSAGLLHSGWTPLTAGRIWAISKKDLLALPADLWPASAYACNSLWHFISSLVTVFIVYRHNINNNDEVIIKSETIKSFCFSLHQCPLIEPVGDSW